MNSIEIKNADTWHGPRKVWVVNYDIYAVPIYAGSKEEATQIAEEDLDLWSIEEIIRMKQWDELESISAYQWIMESGLFGGICAYCDEFVFEMQEPFGPFWTFDGSPVHGPRSETDADCWEEIACMNMKAYEEWVKMQETSDE